MLIIGFVKVTHGYVKKGRAETPSFLLIILACCFKFIERLHGKRLGELEGLIVKQMMMIKTSLLISLSFHRVQGVQQKS